MLLLNKLLIVYKKRTFEMNKETQHNKECHCGCSEHKDSPCVIDVCKCNSTPSYEKHGESGCCCCGGEVDLDEIPDKGLTQEQKSDLIRIIVAAAYLCILKFLEPNVESLSLLLNIPAVVINLILYGIDYLYIGGEVLLKAFKNITKGKVFDENFLMSIATIGAIALGIIDNGDFVEAIAVMLFYRIGEWFEDYAIGRSKKNITNLMDISPDFANVYKDDKVVKVSPKELKVGDVFVVNPGEKIPLDGVVVKGKSSLNTSALTGESVPKEVGCGDEVVSGCISLSGLIEIKTTKVMEESTVSKILELVENSSKDKSKSENFITKFAKIYTPCVCIAALLVALFPPLFITLSGNDPDILDWIYRALTFLVISCPCALVISIPLSFFAGIGGASRCGILIKGSSYLEELSRLNIVIFDKTGTLTKGEFKVQKINVVNKEVIKPFIEENETSEEALLKLAAYAEHSSTHPIARSIYEKYNKNIDLSRISNVIEKSGNGVQTTYLNHEIRVGKKDFIDIENGKANADCEGGTQIYICIDSTYCGNILIADQIKETSCEAIRELYNLGIDKTVMLTGDNENCAKKVANELEMSEYHSNLLPQDKVKFIQSIKSSQKGNSSIAFVGDGINDAPVLMSADLGIAMGGIGSDAAIEAADVVLMNDDPISICKAIKISRKGMAIVYENIFFSLSVKTFVLILGALGFVNMYLAIFADVGVMILAVLNAIRALITRGRF